MSPVNSSISDISSGKPSERESLLFCLSVLRRGLRLGLAGESEVRDTVEVVALLSSGESLAESSELLIVATPSEADGMMRSSVLLTGPIQSSSTVHWPTTSSLSLIVGLTGVKGTVTSLQGNSEGMDSLKKLGRGGLLIVKGETTCLRRRGLVEMGMRWWY